MNIVNSKVELIDYDPDIFPKNCPNKSDKYTYPKATAWIEMHGYPNPEDKIVISNIAVYARYRDKKFRMKLAYKDAKVNYVDCQPVLAAAYDWTIAEYLKNKSINGLPYREILFHFYKEYPKEVLKLSALEIKRRYLPLPSWLGKTG